MAEEIIWKAMVGGVGINMTKITDMHEIFKE